MGRTTSVALVLMFAACGEQEVILSGERLDARGNAIPTETVNRADPLALPAPVVNAEWTHSGGNVRHQQTHVALDRNLQLAWSAGIGEGNDRKHRLTADPVVAGGRIYTLDSRARVTALTTGGATVWTTDLTPATDAPDDASGGGIAVAGSRVFVTSGFGTLMALDSASGDILWTQDLDASATGAPMVSEGVVYVVRSNAIGWAIDANNGRILWQVLGAGSDRSITGGPAPAIAGPLVLFPFSSGQIVSAVAGVGTQTWAASVAGQRLGRGFGVVADLTGGPVVSGNTVYAGSHAGRAAAFDATTGRSLWRADEGAIGPIWLAGGSLFFVSDENRLIRLNAATGETVWAENLPLFTRTRLKRRKATFAHFGPVLGGGRLILASDDGLLRQYDPVTGNVISATPLPDGAARNPVVAGGTLYIVTENGQLHAFR
ncbi:MAG: PQQ-binding-like beta-propeller repeat protein [Alphaproteobacteria bacterium]|nr:PQQ-binding-like beta-propeller repeat protein [Alphaproteobacteria bacterium]